MIKKYIKFKLFTSFINPLFYISALVLALGTGTYAFLFQNFFGGAGTTNLYSFFRAVSFLSLIILPLLSFNQLKSIEELLPIETEKLIISKTISVLIEYLIILLPLLFIPASINLFGNVDAGQLFSGFTGLLFTGLTTISFCIFIQTLIKNQTAGLLIQITILSITALIHSLLLYFNSIPLLTFIAKFISFTWHFESFGKGIIDTRNILYFVLFAASFLSGAFLKTETEKGWKIKTKKNTIFLCSLILLFSFLDSSKYYLRKDFSLNHMTTVSGFTKKLAAGFENTVNITYFRSSTLNDLYPQVREISDYLHELSNIKTVNFSEKDPAKENLTATLESKGIYGREIQKTGTNKTEYETIYSAIVMEYEGKSQIIPFIISANALEYDISIRLKQLLTDRYYIVNVITGNGMSLQNDYGYLTPWLNSQNIIINEIDLSHDISIQLNESPVLLMFGSDLLTEKQCSDIFDFLNNGGRTLLCLSKYNTDIENSWYITKPDNTLFLDKLESYGIFFGEKLIKDISCTRITMESEQNADGNFSNQTYSTEINYPFWVNVLPQKNAPQGITLFWPSELSYDEEKFSPYLFTSSSSWFVEPDKFSQQNLFNTNPFETELQDKNKETYPKTAVLEDKNHRLVVIPDQYFANSLMMGYNGGKTGDYRNLDFLTTEILKLSGEEELSKIHKKSTLSSNTALNKIYDEKSFIEARNRTLFTVYGFIPLLIILSGLLMKILRKKEKFLC